MRIAYQGRLDDKALSGAVSPQGRGRVVRLHDLHPHRSPPRVSVFRRAALQDSLGYFDSREAREQGFFQRPRDFGNRGAERLEAGEVRDHRAALPSELVAFAVGPFDVYDGGVAGHGTPVRVITAKGHAAEGHAAAQATAAILPRLEAYTGIPYAFGKLDHLALPAGAFGAVENPGLITYRVQNLLIPPKQETAARTSALRALEAHEIGHQWFGNLVTQASWDDVWLSEGFATWISAKMMDQEQPPERVHLAAIAARERIMAVDNPTRSRPVRVVVNSRETARDVYNRVVYDKGAAILLMLEGWLGEDRFRDGLRALLERASVRQCDHRETWRPRLRAASGKDPTRVLNTFLNTTGVPELRGEIAVRSAIPPPGCE